MLYFLKRLKLRVIWSWAGCVDVWRTEHSFRSWVWANILSASFALYLPLGTAERALILALGILILAFELINSAIERVVDDIGTDQRPLAKQAKDAGSAGVAVAAIAAGVVWVIFIIDLLR
jgi:diacylglycerol kinase (ATP)